MFKQGHILPRPYILRKIRLSFGFTRNAVDAGFGKHLPDDVQAKLEELRAEQTTDMAKIIYDAMFKDIALAKELDRPMCQDAGVIQYFIEVGDRFPILGKM